MTIKKNKRYKPKSDVYGFEGHYIVKSIDRHYVYVVGENGENSYIVKERFLEYFEEAKDDQDRADK